MIRLLAWLASLALRMPEPEITVTPSGIDPRRLDCTIKMNPIGLSSKHPGPSAVINPTMVVVYDDYSVGVYENNCFVGGSPVMIWA